jgi:hypothetical protein
MSPDEGLGKKSEKDRIACSCSKVLRCEAKWKRKYTFVYDMCIEPEIINIKYI